MATLAQANALRKAQEWVSRNVGVPNFDAKPTVANYTNAGLLVASGVPGKVGKAAAGASVMSVTGVFSWGRGRSKRSRAPGPMRVVQGSTIGYAIGQAAESQGIPSEYVQIVAAPGSDAGAIGIVRPQPVYQRPRATPPLPQGAAGSVVTTNYIIGPQPTEAASTNGAGAAAPAAVVLVGLGAFLLARLSKGRRIRG